MGGLTKLEYEFVQRMLSQCAKDAGTRRMKEKCATIAHKIKKYTKEELDKNEKE